MGTYVIRFKKYDNTRNGKVSARRLLPTEVETNSDPDDQAIILTF